MAASGLGQRSEGEMGAANECRRVKRSQTAPNFVVWAIIHLLMDGRLVHVSQMARRTNTNPFYDFIPLATFTPNTTGMKKNFVHSCAAPKMRSNFNGATPHLRFLRMHIALVTFWVCTIRNIRLIEFLPGLA